jgi:phosphoserine phosphatase
VNGSHSEFGGPSLSAESCPWRVFSFDLDGTLARRATSLHMANGLGHGDLIRDLEDQYERGSLSARAFAEAEARFYAGLSMTRISELLADLPFIDGIAETLQALRERNVLAIIGTGAWRFAAQVVGDRFGVSEVSGVEMRMREAGTLSGHIEKHFDELDKVAFVRAYCSRHGVAMSQVVAVGDARSDIPLFGAVGFSVALNATPAAQAAASISLRSDRLPDVLAVIPRL